MKNRNTNMLLCVPEIKYAYGPNECQTSKGECVPQLSVTCKTQNDENIARCRLL